MLVNFVNCLSVFTFSHSVVDDVVIDVEPLCPRDAKGWREAIMKSAALNVSVSC